MGGTIRGKASWALENRIVEVRDSLAEEALPR